MKHTLPPLGFASDALAPFLSDETFAYHHGKHHRGYVDKLNALVASTDIEEGVSRFVEWYRGYYDSEPVRTEMN